MYKFLHERMFPFLLSVHLGVEFLGHTVNLCFTFSEIARLLSNAAAPFYMPSSNIWGHWLLPILINICYYVFLHHNHLSRWKVGSHCGFDFHAHDGYNAIFSYASWPFVYILCRNAYSDPLPIFKHWVICPLIIEL